jgi:glyoxylase-like metal-dependent hydrolase (beta-lactamase superfamily II)
MPTADRHDHRDHQPTPGVHRLGDGSVNFYLVEADEGITLVDAGLPAHFDLLRACLARIGRDLTDVRAVLITHGHPDHTGLAERLRAEAGAEVWVSRLDAPILADGPRSAMRHAKPERSALPYLLRRPAAIATPLHFARQGAFTAPAVREVTTFGDDPQGSQLDATVPGRPQVVPLPGHTPGSVGYLFADRGVVFTGDALVTEDGLTGRTGPSLVARAFTSDSTAALASLDRLATLPATLVLPGHGLPFPGAPAQAATLARQAGPR